MNLSARKRLDIILFLYTGMPQNPQFCNVIQILFVMSYLSCVDRTGNCLDSWENVPGHRWGFWDLFLELGWIRVDI